jgi:hypothetical protein
VGQLVNEFQTGHLLEKKWKQTWSFSTQETLDNTGPYLEAFTIKNLGNLSQETGVPKVSRQSQKIASFEAIDVYSSTETPGSRLCC